MALGLLPSMGIEAECPNMVQQLDCRTEGSQGEGGHSHHRKLGQSSLRCANMHMYIFRDLDGTQELINTGLTYVGPSILSHSRQPSPSWPLLGLLEAWSS